MQDAVKRDVDGTPNSELTLTNFFDGSLRLWDNV